eukprot:scaffold36452_cov60-Phaeocystis_antarctica.AAC.1
MLPRHAPTVCGSQRVAGVLSIQRRNVPDDKPALLRRAHMRPVPEQRARQSRLRQLLRDRWEPDGR